MRQCERSVRLVRLFGLAVAAVVLGAAFAPSAWAIPAFARKYNVTCSTCHVAAPYLNAFGREFKETGYRMPTAEGDVDPDAQNLQKLSDALYLEKMPPVSFRAVLRPAVYTKTSGEPSEKNLDSVHELEILAAGNVHGKASFFFEVEGEDEESFEIAGEGILGLHPTRRANLQIGYSGPFHFDPYNSLKDGGHRLTVAHKAPLSLDTGVDAVLRKPAQFVTFYGRSQGLFYAFGVTGATQDAEGEDPKSVVYRLAYDFGQKGAVGLFGWTGFSRENILGQDVEFDKLGVDFNVDSGPVHVYGLLMVDKPQINGVSMTERAGYVEFLYTVMKQGRPTWVPIVRLDHFTVNDGDDDNTSIVLNLSRYVYENVRFGVEVDRDLSVPAGLEKTTRVAVLGDIAF